MRYVPIVILSACLPMATIAHAAEEPGSILDRLYVATDFGVSLVPDVKTRSIPTAAGAFGLSELDIDMEVGIDWSVELGLRLSEQWSVELQSGYVYNRIRGVGSGEFTAPPFPSEPVAGGEGHFGQVPILVNAVWDIPILERESGLGSLTLQLGGGVGTVYVQGEVSAEGTGSLAGLEINADGGDWTFGYQGTAALLWGIAPNVEIGIRYRFMGTTAADLGPITDSAGVLAPGNLETEAVFTNAIQASLAIRF
jgi:hypothetical protein